MEKTKEKFITSDFYTAVFLMASGYKLFGINKTEPRRHRFIFEDDKNRAKLLEDFFNNKTKVEARKFIGAIKELKSLMYNDAV